MGDKCRFNSFPPPPFSSLSPPLSPATKSLLAASCPKTNHYANDNRDPSPPNKLHTDHLARHPFGQLQPPLDLAHLARGAAAVGRGKDP